MSTRAVAWTVTLVAGAAFVVLAAVLVPWRPYPGELTLPDPVAVFGAEHVARAEAYAGQARLWSRLSLVVSVLTACLLGFTRLRGALTTRLRGPWWLQSVVVVVALAVIGRLVTLPFGILLRRLQLREGLSEQSWGGYARDLLVSEAVAVVATALAVLVLTACVRRLPRAWPAAAAGIVAALVMLGSFVYPVLVEPLTHDFTSLPDGRLRTEILDLADREGIAVDDVLVVDASRRTTTLNAYVSGFGSTRRVVVYDNLVAELPTDEALAVVAHELSHAAHDDVLVGSLLGATGAAAAVGLLGLVATGRRRRSPDLRTPAAVPWLLAVVALGSVVATPAQSTISRQIETRADVDALRTSDTEAFIRLQEQLAAHSLSDPDPAAWSQWWFGTHPTALQRIALAEAIATEGAYR